MIVVCPAPLASTAEYQAPVTVISTVANTGGVTVPQTLCVANGLSYWLPASLKCGCLLGTDPGMCMGFDSCRAVCDAMGPSVCRIVSFKSLNPAANAVQCWFQADFSAGDGVDVATTSFCDPLLGNVSSSNSPPPFVTSGAVDWWCNYERSPGETCVKAVREGIP